MTNEEFDFKLGEILRHANARRKPYQFMTMNQMNLIYKMITSGCTYNEIKSAFPKMSTSMYYNIFDLVALKTKKEAVYRKPDPKIPYWNTEREMIYHPPSINDLKGAELEIYQEIR